MFSILSVDPDQVSVYGDLCLSYLDLCGLTLGKMIKIEKALDQALRLVNKKDKQETFSNICKIVKLILDENYKKAITLVDKELNSSFRTCGCLFLLSKSLCFKRT